MQISEVKGINSMQSEDAVAFNEGVAMAWFMHP
jgi:hypothetical protein